MIVVCLFVEKRFYETINKLLRKNSKRKIIMIYHKIGHQYKDQPSSIEEAMQVANLNWNVELKPLVFFNSQKQITPSGRRAVVRSDTESVLGVVGSNYETLQNIEAFSVFEPLFESGDFKYEVAGCFGKGSKIWLVCSLKGKVPVGDDDEVLKYITLVNSHDGRKSLSVFLSPVRPVCSNALAAGSRKSDFWIKIAHFEKNMNQVREQDLILNKLTDHYKTLESQWNSLAKTRVSKEDVAAYINKLLPGHTKKALDSKNNIIKLVVTGQGQNRKAANGTAWGLYNAVTQHLTHTIAKRVTSTEKTNVESLWFGEKQKLNERAFDLALQLAA